MSPSTGVGTTGWIQLAWSKRIVWGYVLPDCEKRKYLDAGKTDLT